jgi:hypothetical protein
MKLYVDDIRNTPNGFNRAYSVNQAIAMMTANNVQEISLDHDMGDFANDGGDVIKLVYWMIQNSIFPPVVHFHTSNPVGLNNMKSALMRYGNYANYGNTIILR